MASLEVDNLTDSELRSKLAECGHPVGPVTETTRKILIKKLKILMKQKNSVKNTNRSLSRFSSGDDSGSDTDQNGRSRNSRRISMPPPTSYKSSKRRTSTRNNTPDVSPVPLSSKISSSTPIGPTRSNADVRNRFSAPSSIKQTYFPSTNRSSIGSSSFTYDFDSGSDSDVTDLNRSTTSSTRRRIGPTYGTLSSYRSRLNNSNSSQGSKNSTDLNISRSPKPYSNKKESRPNLLSGFVGRLSRINNALNPQDIKESDVEEDGPSDKWISVNVSARNSINNNRDWGLGSVPFKSVYQTVKTKESAATYTKWKSWNNSQLCSMVLLALLIIFFIWVGVAYFNIKQRSALTGKSNNFYPFCTDEDDKLARVNCIKKEELPFAVQLYKDVHLELQARALRSVCGPVLEDGSLQKASMTERELVLFLSRSTDTPDIWKIEQGIDKLKLLLLANRHWGITLVKKSDDYEPNANCAIPDNRLALPSDFNGEAEILFISPCPRVPWTCYLIRLFYIVLFYVAMLSLGVSAAYLAVVSYRYHKKSKKEEHEQVMAMVERILEYVSETSEKANASVVDANGSSSVGPLDYVAVRHVHDTLIHPTERQSMATVWSKAVKFIEENESRIRTEIQQVWGEDATVWRWLGPPLNRTQATTPEGSNESNHLYPDLSSLKAECRKGSDRVWQGEAFETSEGSMNSLPYSPTQCLKIRHMFKPDKDYGPDWVLKVHDAIIEKCEGAKIIHLSVDQQSKEGCVYVKCASQQDAGLAYRHLHGSWFDGALVTVKYLRLERYHERFPDSVNAKLQLRPSNNLKLSLQGNSSA